MLETFVCMDLNAKPLFQVGLSCPTTVGREHNKIKGGICLSVCPSVCLPVDLTQERKGLGSPKLAVWKPTTG